MKKFLFLTTVLILSLVLTSCVTVVPSGASATTSQTTALKAYIDIPLPGTNLPAGPVEISYHATAQEGISAIELSVDGKTLSHINAPDPKQPLVTLKYTWTPESAGEHILRVRAQSSNGSWSDDAVVTVQVPGAAANNSQPAQPTQTQAAPTQSPTMASVAATATPQGVYFTSVTKDTDKLFMTNCGTFKLTLTAMVSDPAKVYSVLVFTRLWDNEGQGFSNWDTGHAMNSNGNGVFTFTFAGDKIPNPKGFEFTVLYYQFVAVDKNQNRLAKTDVYKDVSYVHC